METWKEKITNFDLFWHIMNEIDEEMLVLDPATVCKKHTYRRLLLGK